jgi:small-conductance mechanosensitive channel
MLDSTLKVMDSMALTISGFRLSMLIAVKTVILFGALLWLAATISAIAEQRIVSALEIDPTIAVLVGKVLRATLFLIAVFASFSAIGIDLTALAVFSGAIGLGIGFGLQKVASNLISGFIILLDRSIKPGDVISLGSTFGWITELKARYVQVNTRDGIEYLIPNETFITERLANMSHSDRSIRLELKFGVSYDSDPHLVKSLAIDCVTALPRVIAFPVPVCHIVAFGDSSIDFVLRFWIQDPENGMTNVRGDAFLALWDVFKQNGIKIPYPHRDILVRNETGATTLPDSDRSSNRKRMSSAA